MRDACVVFDLDDTLYLERDYVVSGFNAVGQWAAEWMAIPNFAERCLNLLERGDRGDIFDSVLREFGRAATPQLVAGLVEIYRAHLPAIKMAPDAEQALTQLRRSWPIAIITDGPVLSQTRKCKSLGLSSFAWPLVLTGFFGNGFRKPHKMAFEYVASCIEARQFVYVADNPAKDFTAPKQLGWLTVRVRRSGGLHFGRPNEIVVPDFEIPNCSGLPLILSQVLKSEL
jgi:putative hydrolase of the HAD superfamily